MEDRSPEITNQFHRRSIRMQGFDYTLPGAYFVTVVTFHRLCLLGEVVDGEMRLNQYGQIVKRTWKWLSKQYPYVYSDVSIVMPNHFHGILRIQELEEPCRGGLCATWFGGARPAPTKIKPLGELISVFKTVSAKQINQFRSSPGVTVWQRNYYEHIIRNQSEMDDFAGYIIANPSNWTDDPEYIS